MGAKGTVLAVAAHPDDIEFMMGGTFILLGRAGYELHYMNVANGDCGTAAHSRGEIARIRAREAKAAAALAGAVHHRSIARDIEVFYDRRLLARLGAVVREVNPEIMLIPSLEDYMEDHTNAARLAVTAAFTRGMRNFVTSPRRKPVTGDTVLYHALPYGLRDGMRRRVRAETYVDIGSVLAAKREMLAAHRSQKEWLDYSQGVDAYLKTMEEMSAEVGRMSGRFQYAEGWRRHSRLGFAAEERDPLTEALGGKVVTDPRYGDWLEGGR